MKGTRMKRMLWSLVLAGMMALVSQAQGTPTITAVYTDCTSVRVEINNPTTQPVLVELKATDNLGNSVIGVSTFTVGAAQRGGTTFTLPNRLTTNINFETFIFDSTTKNVAYGRNSQDCNNEPQPLNNRDQGTPFRVFCDATGGVNFLLLNSQGNAISGVNATVGQIAGALISAANTLSNQPAATSASGLSIWALTSGELQAVYRGTTNYDFVFPITNCGGLDISGPISLMITTLNTNPPPANPFAPTAPSFPPASGFSPGIVAPTVGGTCAPLAPNTRAHSVQRGQTLFRIGLAYGVPFGTIATLNGLYNPDRIYAGQCLQIP